MPGGGTGLVGGTPYPQKGNNKTRRRVLSDLAGYIGGENNADILEFCASIWDDVIRRANTTLWKFNRRKTDITFLANTSEYSLPAKFFKAQAVSVVDSDDQEVFEVGYVPFELWTELFPDQQTHSASFPDYYTLENPHETGLIKFEPRLGATFTYPKARLWWFQRIERAQGENDVLNVPEEVDQALFMVAVGEVVSKRLGFNEASGYMAQGGAMMKAVIAMHAGFEDYFQRVG